MTRPQQWIVVADERNATMFSCKATPGGHWHLESVGSIANGNDPVHPQRSPNAPSDRRGDEQEHHRFALEVAGREGWLPHTLTEQKADRVHVFAPADFLGALRQVMASKGQRESGTLAGKTTLLEGNFAQLHPGQLASQPKIVEALGGPAQ